MHARRSSWRHAHLNVALGVLAADSVRNERREKLAPEQEGPHRRCGRVRKRGGCTSRYKSGSGGERDQAR
eukprot:6212275-Pleurochrysis_carterae.AAC.3